jgi:hypothetical protein
MGSAELEHPKRRSTRGTTVSWRDEGGTLRRRWFREQSEAESFVEHITGAPGICDYLSDILGELEAHRTEIDAIRAAAEDRSELEKIRTVLEDIRDLLGSAR